MKLWGGRFEKPTDKLVEAYTASIPFDWRLYPYDIAGSIAHCRMLGRRGIIPPDEAEQIVQALQEIRHELDMLVAEGAPAPDPALEDVHTMIEARLREKVGDLAGKLHTARSRNDQVALDERLYLREAIAGVAEQALKLQGVLLDLAAQHVDTIMPGYTHLQRAQPVTLGHHLLAYFEMLDRDLARLRDCFGRVNVLPLGAGALAGVPFPIDRQMVAQELGFESVVANSIDAVADRDFLLEFHAAAAIIMVHLSRLAEEIVLWSSAEFGFLELDDAFATGSSIMPQKKNPDPAELARGKTGRVIGHLIALLTTMKGLPLAYNRDMQEDKEGLFDTVETVRRTLEIMAGMLATATFKPERMAAAAAGGFSTATDVADYLVRKGVPFREAHAIAGAIVRRCIARGITLEDLPLEEFREFSPLFEEDVLEAATARASVASRISEGGTAPERVREALAQARARYAASLDFWSALARRVRV